MPRLNSILSVIVLSALSACILVDDFGPAWKQSKSDGCLSKIGESLYYTEFRRDPAGQKMDDLLHGLSRSNGTQYLLLKQQANDAGGRMYRFRVVNGILQRLRIVPSMRKKFEQDYPDAPVNLARDTIRFAQLGEKEWALIDNIATQPEYWEIEDQTLYNPLQDPDCRFEDRDLSKLEK